MRLGIRLGIALGCVLPVGIAGAATVPYFDDFESIGATGTQLNTPPAGWDAVLGTVDSVRAPDYNITCAGGSTGCVDLDGSTQNSAVFLTSDEFQLQAGQQYKLTFDLSGSQRGGFSPTDSVFYGFGDATSFGTILKSDTAADIPWDAPFTTYTLLFTAAADTAAYLFFSNIDPNANDNVGPILDNVRLAAVPIPAAGWLLISGLVGLVGVARRRQSGGVTAA